MIYLQPEVKSGLGEDTFWTWFAREIGGTFDPPPGPLGPHDIALRYSTLGPCRPGDEPRTIALLWELLPEMKEVLGGTAWDEKIARTMECAKHAARRFVATPLAVRFYTDCGPVEVLPIGVDMDLFSPRRDRRNLPPTGFWCGTTHPMKGYRRLKEFARLSFWVRWIIVWKSEAERAPESDFLPNSRNYTRVSQVRLAELMNEATFLACPGLLHPYFMVEWEAMACDLPVINLGPEKDFPSSEHPRPYLFELGWSRNQLKEEWIRILRNMEVEW